MQSDDQGQPKISHFTVDIRDDSSREEVAAFLKACRDEHRARFHKEKLLLILDGLDEIPPGSKTVFDLIPHGDELPEGVYILTTSRLPAELKDKPFSQEQLDRLQPDQIKILTREQEYNQELMRSYIRSKILIRTGKLTAEQQQLSDILMEKSEGRFLYLKALKEMLRLTDDPGILPVGAGLLGYYLEQVEQRYSEKYFSSLLGFLLILASAPEPVTIRELAFLSDNVVSFRILAYINDLRGFIRVERSYRGKDLLSISNDDWRGLLREKCRNKLQEIIRQWMEKWVYSWQEGKLTLFRSEMERKIELWDGESYPLSHLQDYLQSYFSIEEERQLMNGKMVFFLQKSALELSKSPSPARYVSERVIAIYAEVITIIEHLQEEVQLKISSATTWPRY